MRNIVFYITVAPVMFFFLWLGFLGAKQALGLNDMGASIVGTAISIACGYAYSKFFEKKGDNDK